MSHDEKLPVLMTIHEGPAAEVFNEVVSVPFLLRKSLWNGIVLGLTTGFVSGDRTSGYKGMVLALIIRQAVKRIRRAAAPVKIVVRDRVPRNEVLDPAIDLIHSRVRSRALVSGCQVIHLHIHR